MSETTHIHGVPIYIVSDEEAERSDVVACMRFADAVQVAPGSHIEKCSWCGEPVWVHRTSPRKPARVCVVCLLKSGGV